MDGGAGDAYDRVRKLEEKLKKMCDHYDGLKHITLFSDLEDWVTTQTKLYDEARVLLTSRWC
jgi:hypothetical protein